MRQLTIQFLNRHLVLLAALGSLVVLVTLFLFDPAESAWYPKCVFHELTGWHCPGCGTLRASYLLLHGELLAALSMNVLAVVFLSVYAPAYLYRGFKGGGWRVFETFTFSPWVGWMVALIVVAFWILRNLDVTRLNWLAP
jgi:Protein of unknown function (DUF2752)